MPDDTFLDEEFELPLAPMQGPLEHTKDDVIAQLEAENAELRTAVVNVVVFIKEAEARIQTRLVPLRAAIGKWGV